MKICVKCKQSLSLDKFSKNKSKKDGLAGMCKECWNSYYKKEYYQNGKEKERLLKKNIEHRNKIKNLLDSLKSVPCLDCKKIYPPYVMDFDHRDPLQKKFTIASVKYKSEQDILTEISKCDIVCANCHRIRTHSGVA